MMKKYFSFMSFLFVAAIILFATNSGFSQGVSLNPNSLPVITNNDFGVACSGGQIHDDGVAENGYGWNASAGVPGSSFSRARSFILYSTWRGSSTN